MVDNIPAKSILLIGNERSVIITRQAILSGAGYLVSPATSVKGALSALESFHFDVVLIGSLASQRERQSLAEASRRLQPNVPLVMILQHPGERDGLADAVVSSLEGPEALLEAIVGVLNKQA